MQPVDPQAMRDTLRLWASGVSVVTTALATPTGNQRAGMTVSAFNSLSLEPPSILVCLSKATTTVNLMAESDVFAVSILSEDSAELSDRFAGRHNLAENADRFLGVETHTASTGSPILSAALAWLDCKVCERYDGNTHWIVIGEVVATGQRDANVSPLLYYDRGYRTIAP
ncbi:MAG: flavin reductase [Chloroflexi bacterium]|nr:flavin reductase [Chloroflexota bacterium]